MAPFNNSAPLEGGREGGSGGGWGGHTNPTPPTTLGPLL